MNRKHKKIAVIGAGIAGLAVAARLAIRGHSVEVYESNSYAGGKCSEFSDGPYRFDAGPSLFTMPHYVDELFQLANESPKDYFSYESLPTVCEYFWEDGTALTGFANLQKFGKEVEDKLSIPKEKVNRFFQRSKEKYELTGTTFLEHSLHRTDTWLTKAVGKAIFNLGKLDLFKTMNEVHRKAVLHPKFVQLLNRFATYNGSNPYRATGLLSMIPHFEHGIGAFYPDGGMIAITNAIHQLAERHGAAFHFSQPVEEILLERKKAVGIKLNGKVLQFDMVVSNMDVFYTYKQLMPSAKHPEPQLNQERSSSALIFYWGVKKEFPQLNLHNIIFSESYRKEFDCLEKGEVSIDPTVYINISAKYSKEDAPKGCENWFVMINVPFASNQNWETLIPRIRKNTIEKINRVLKTDLNPLIETESILDPRGIESKTSSYQGALYGTSSNERLSAFLRHPNFTNRKKNLYFCGGSVHPGGGVPLCLLSAKIVDQLILDGY